ncbi:Glutathione S-transferase omega-1 [Smittium culicis]|uniref:Glutathione S-transferase omega-1 n=1 Tax=Smittium culicis TaxID=133412 RepID=A0A1R1XIH8_9FUNG|nr:Glutathione S-transferase omega-1 [Smittium culicis]
MYPYKKDKITLYHDPTCPFSHRTVLALKETNVDYESIEIDINKKPEWYSHVNPLLKVPAMRLPTGEILVESLFIAEYVADLNPKSLLMPTSALERYKTRLFIDYFSNNILPLPFKLLGLNSKEAEKQKFFLTITEKLRELNNKLVEVSKSGPFFLGKNYSIADIASITLVERMEIAIKFSNLSIEDITGIDRFNQWKSSVKSKPNYSLTVPTVEKISATFKKFIK